MKHLDSSAFALRPNNALKAYERWACSFLFMGGVIVLLFLNPLVEKHAVLLLPAMIIFAVGFILEAQVNFTKRGAMAALASMFFLLGLGILFQTNKIFIFFHFVVAVLIALLGVVLVFRTK